MAKLIASSALVLALISSTSIAQADEASDAVADEAGVNPFELADALATLRANGIEVSAEQYLCDADDWHCPAPPVISSCGWPICGLLGQRIYCVEGIESNHGRAMYNPVPVGREHAQGWLGFLPSTAARWGVTIGSRASEWSGAARMIGAGAGAQFAGIAWGRC